LFNIIAGIIARDGRGVNRSAVGGSVKAPQTAGREAVSISVNSCLFVVLLQRFNGGVFVFKKFLKI
jgi:hypothetical protein